MVFKWLLTINTTAGAVLKQTIFRKIVSLIASTCNTKYLEERILILSSFAQKLQLKQAEEGQVYFDP